MPGRERGSEGAVVAGLEILGADPATPAEALEGERLTATVCFWVQKCISSCLRGALDPESRGEAAAAAVGLRAEQGWALPRSALFVIRLGELQLLTLTNEEESG